MKKELSLRHEILPPANYKEGDKAPLLIMLHGYGSHEGDLFSMAPMLNQKFFIISLRAPLALPWGGFAWYELDFNKGRSEMGNGEQARESLVKLESFVSEALSAYPVDATDVWLMGFSQGCILSLLLASHHPEMFKGLIGMSGYLWQELLPSDADWQKMGELALFLTHGRQDDVIPIEWARQSYAVLTENGIKASLREYPMPHGISQECFNDLQAWLASHNKLYSGDWR